MQKCARAPGAQLLRSCTDQILSCQAATARLPAWAAPASRTGLYADALQPWTPGPCGTHTAQRRLAGHVPKQPLGRWLLLSCVQRHDPNNVVLRFLTAELSLLLPVQLLSHHQWHRDAGHQSAACQEVMDQGRRHDGCAHWELKNGVCLTDCLLDGCVAQRGGRRLPLGLPVRRAHVCCSTAVMEASGLRQI